MRVGSFKKNKKQLQMDLTPAKNAITAPGGYPSREDMLKSNAHLALRSSTIAKFYPPNLMIP